MDEMNQDKMKWDEMKLTLGDGKDELGPSHVVGSDLPPEHRRVLPVIPNLRRFLL